MAKSEHAPASMESALDRIEGAMDRIARAAQRAKMARLEAVGQNAQLELRHEILRGKVGEALTSLDGLIARVEKAQVPDAQDSASEP